MKEDLYSVTVVISGVSHILVMQRSALSKVYTAWMGWWNATANAPVVVTFVGYIDSLGGPLCRITAPCSEITSWTMSRM